MLRAIGRVIRSREEQRCIENNERPQIPFNILSDVCYQREKLATDQAV